MSKRAEAAWVVLGFTCLAVAATFPLARHAAGALPSDLGDPLLTAWSLAWDADRLRHGLRGVWDAPNFFPYRHTLLYSDHLLGVALFTAPLQWIGPNALAAYNAAFVGSFVLAGAGMYVLARELTGRRDAALVAGLVFAFQPFRISHIAHLQWLITGWLPLGLWALHRYFAARRARWLLAAAVCFVLQATTASYFTYFALLPYVVVGASEWRRTRTPVGTLLRDCVPAIVLVALVLLPIARAYYDVRAMQGLKRSAEDIASLSADVGDYFSAPPALTLWGGLGAGRGEHELFPGALAMLLAAVAIVVRFRSPAVVLYTAVGAIALVLSLGPHPTAWGHSPGVPGPYALLLRVVPGLDGLRAPTRLAVVVQIAVSVLAACGAAWLLDRAGRARVPVLIAMAGVIAAEGWAAPIRIAAFDPRGSGGDRDAYEYLKTLPSGAVMELPTSVDFIDPEFVYQFMTVVHGHRVVNGHSGYVTPLVQWLGGGHSPFRETGRQRDAIAMLRGFGVRYIVVHRGRYEDPALADEMIGAFGVDGQQVIQHRTFGDTTMAMLTPLDAPAPPATTMIPLAAMQFAASHGADRLPLLVDGDHDTRWISGRPQAGDEWLHVALDRARDVRLVRMQVGVRSFGDYPRDLEIVAEEGEASRTLFRGTVLPQFARGIIADGEYPWIEIVLPENHATALRLRQAGSARVFSWSIHELRLFERL